jgi:hypothetical protein
MDITARTDFPGIQYLVEAGVFGADPFTLIDVGCRGGIHPRWRAFGKDLTAYAIDPLVNEIENLKAQEENPNVTYWPAYIGLPFEHPLMRSRAARGPWGNFPWQRLSSAWAGEIMNSDADDESTRLQRNDWSSASLTEPDNRIGLNEFAKQRQIESVDCVKIDVDGEDLYVLLSGEDLIAHPETLGFELEVAFFGTASETDNTFHNTDRLMRAHGYELFDLTVRRYSRRALPAPFALQMPAQTDWGAPNQADVLYLRDVVGNERPSPGASLSTAKLFKMIAIHELFGLPDCAAEVVLAFKEQLSSVVNVHSLLDLLTPKVNGESLTYQQYCSMFSQDPTSFYPPPPQLPELPVRKPPNILRSKLSSLKRRLNGRDFSWPRQS